MVILLTTSPSTPTIVFVETIWLVSVVTVCSYVLLDATVAVLLGRAVVVLLPLFVYVILQRKEEKTVVSKLYCLPFFSFLSTVFIALLSVYLLSHGGSCPLLASGLQTGCHCIDRTCRVLGWGRGGPERRCLLRWWSTFARPLWSGTWSLG